MIDPDDDAVLDHDRSGAIHGLVDQILADLDEARAHEYASALAQLERQLADLERES